MRGSTGLSLFLVLVAGACTPKQESAPEAKAEAEAETNTDTRTAVCDAEALGSLAQSLEAAEAWDLAGLADLAKVAKTTTPEMVSAVVSGENSITVGVFMATYAALLGPGCKQADAEGCQFPTLVVEAGAG